MTIWICPNCAEPLFSHESGWHCENKHSFDRAKQGYINLLLANQKNSKTPGDNSAMVESRRQFLRTGSYDFMIYEVISVLEKNLQSFYAHGAKESDSAFTLLDLGCGEAYYLERIARSQQLVRSTEANYYGLDISKAAIKKAASFFKLGSFAVASSYNIPVASASVDCLLSIFAPFSDSEVARILKPHGIFIRVSPARKHLWQLKSVLYKEAQQHRPPKPVAGLSIIDKSSVSRELHIDGGEKLSNLLEMTPLNWHGSREGKAALLAQGSLDVSVDFDIEVMS